MLLAESLEALSKTPEKTGESQVLVRDKHRKEQGTIETISSWMAPAVAVFIVIVVVVAIKSITSKRLGATVARKNMAVQLSTIGVLFMGVLIVIALSPLEDSNKQNVVAVFGIMITGVIGLSSATFVGNAMAGLMLKTMKNFKPGDFVRVGDQFGRVTLVNLLHTEIQTPDRDLTTLPNLYLVTNPVTVARQSGTIVSCDISLGYDVGHEKIEVALVKAANAIGLVDPFVLIVELGDFSVHYRINGLLEEIKVLVSIRSRLRKAVLDALHGAGIEIVSPNFMNQRVHPLDKPFIPDEYLEGNRSRTRHQSSTTLEALEDLPDAKIFDKAEEAGGKVVLDEALHRVEDKIAEIKAADKGKGKDTEAHMEKRKRRLEAFEAHKESIVEKIAEVDETLKNSD